MDIENAASGMINSSELPSYRTHLNYIAPIITQTKKKNGANQRRLIPTHNQDRYARGSRDVLRRPCGIRSNFFSRRTLAEKSRRALHGRLMERREIPRKMRPSEKRRLHAYLAAVIIFRPRGSILRNERAACR